MGSGNCRIIVQRRSEEFCLEISVSQTSSWELPKSNTYTPKWMSNEKFVVQRPFAVQPSITCCGFSTANGKLWASEPLSAGSVHEILRLWLYNSICACLCVGSPWLLQPCEFPKLNSRDRNSEAIVKWQGGGASRTGTSPRTPVRGGCLLWRWTLGGD